jgi:hypothetical protein
MLFQNICVKVTINITMGLKVGTLVICFSKNLQLWAFGSPSSHTKQKGGAVSMKYCAKNLQFYRKLFQQVLRFFEN